MGLNNSIVGRSYRTKNNQIVYDIENDPDWDKKGESEYNSVIAIYHKSLDGKAYILSFDYKNDEPRYSQFLERNSFFIINLFEKAKEIEYSNNSISFDDFDFGDDDVQDENADLN